LVVAAASATTACEIGGFGAETSPTADPGALRTPPPYLAPVPLPLPPPVQMPALMADFAGTGDIGDGGDGGPAETAQFRSVGGVAVGSDGQIFVSDPSASRIRRIRTDGVIEALAGTGIRGFGGDGGHALGADFTDPARLLVDQVGTLFVAELDRVRRIDPSGLVSTILGDGHAGVEGDGGPAAFARTAGNEGMAIDGDGNLFVAERAANRVRRIDSQGNVATVAGTGAAGSNGDGGPALSASLNQPVDVDVDGQGNLLIAELAGNRIRRVSTNGFIDTIAGTGVPGGGGDGGPAAGAELHGPQSVVVDATGAVFVADWNNRRIRRIHPDGTIQTVAGLVGGRVDSGGPALESSLTLPLDIAPTLDGKLLIVEQSARRVRALVPAAPSTSVGQPVEGAQGDATDTQTPPVAQLPPAAGLPSGAPLAGDLVAEIFAGTGQSGSAADGEFRLNAVFSSPRGVALDGLGRLLIADTGNHRIRRIEPDGRISVVAGTGEPGHSGDGLSATAAQLNRPSALVVDGQGSIYVADAGNFRIRKIDPDGVITTFAGTSQPGVGGDGGPAREAQLTEPTGLALGSDGSLFVVDSPVHRVRVIRPDGVIRPFAGSGVDGTGGDGGPAADAALGFPQRVAVGADGSVLVTQLQAGVVRRISPDGIISTAAGSGRSESATEGPAREVSFDSPIGVSVDTVGAFYVVASGSGYLVRVDPSGHARVVAGNPLGQGQSGDLALDIPLFTSVDMALGRDGSGYLLEARGLIWRISGTAPAPAATAADGEATPTPTATDTPALQAGAVESAEARSVILALQLGPGQEPIQPTLTFHPGERVNVSIEFVNVVQGARLGIRWSAGDRVQGTFLTDPQPAYREARFGFWFGLPPEAALGSWRVEVMVGSNPIAAADFAVTPGEVRSNASAS
jgi:sugar lactone lactonase YvrE